MTTGRINQVTIVRRGWPSGALGRRRDCPSYWWAPARWLGAPPAAPSARPWAPLAAIRFPPLSSPGHPSAAAVPLWALWLRGPRWRTSPGSFRHGVVRGRWLPPVVRLLLRLLAIGQLPTAPGSRLGARRLPGGAAPRLPRSIA